MRNMLSLLILLLPLAAAKAKADTFVLTGSGTDDSFTLASSPTITSSGSYGFYVAPVDVDENGTTVASQITFFSSDLGGGLLLQDGLGDILDGFGPSLYQGANNNPTFLTGTFALSDLDSYTLTMSNTAATPEPSTLVLIGSGLLSVCGMAVKRRAVL